MIIIWKICETCTHCAGVTGNVSCFETGIFSLKMMKTLVTSYYYQFIRGYLKDILLFIPSGFKFAIKQFYFIF